ncbi:MoaD/ThiS family protein [Schaalia odontolytica]|mgnify:FL=1
MNHTSRSRPLAETLAAMAALTPAQHALLERISHHASPVTVAELAQEAGLHVSSVRETLEGLFTLGLVEKQQLPSSGRGRPALGYSTTTPADPSFAAQMLHQLTSSLLAWLRADAADPAASVREIGSRWADAALETMDVPDHSHVPNHRPVRDTFNIATHMGKVRLFMNAMGFASIPHDTDRLAVVLTACPFTEPGTPDDLALELRRGIVERVFERTATGYATWSVDVDPVDPLRMTIYIRPLNEANPKPLSTTLHFFGGAAEAAGGYVREVPSAQTPATLGELVKQLSAESPELERILAVSSYLVNERSARPDKELAPGARVDVLPPFAGG